MIRKTGFSVGLHRIAMVLALVVGVMPVRAEQLPVVATFSILGDMVKQIGGDRISVTSLVGPDDDTHVFVPTPADARSITKARVLVANGLEFEGWMERLFEAAAFNGVMVVATDGVDAIRLEEHGETHDDHEKHKDEHDEHKQAKGHDDHKSGHDQHEHGDHHGHDHGEFDPHAWQDLTNAKVYSRNIAAGLSKADPGNAAYYQKRLDDYIRRITSLDAELKKSLSQLPPNRRTVVTSHDAFQYFGRAYGLTFLAPQGLSTESEASAADVAKLITQIRTENIKAVFVENLSDSRLIERIADETGATVGGTLYPGALSPSDGPAPTYLDMVRVNAEVIRKALQE